MGIQDRKVLRIISKMLKAEMEKEGLPSKGTPHGESYPLFYLSIVLHDLDKWIAGQWENFKTFYPYKYSHGRRSTLKRIRLKEGYIVRYADDFRILCRDWESAQKWFHANKTLPARSIKTGNFNRKIEDHEPKEKKELVSWVYPECT